MSLSRRAPGRASPRLLDIRFTIDVEAPPSPRVMWVYVERPDGVRGWVRGQSETECSLVGVFRVYGWALSAEEPQFSPGP